MYLGWLSVSYIKPHELKYAEIDRVSFCISASLPTQKPRATPLPSVLYKEHS